MLWLFVGAVWLVLASSWPWSPVVGSISPIAAQLQQLGRMTSMHTSSDSPRTPMHERRLDRGLAGLYV